MGWPDHCPELHRTAGSEHQQPTGEPRAERRGSKPERFQPSCIGLENGNAVGRKECCVGHNGYICLKIGIGGTEAIKGSRDNAKGAW